MNDRTGSKERRVGCMDGWMDGWTEGRKEARRLCVNAGQGCKVSRAMTAKCANFLLGPGLCLPGRARVHSRDGDQEDQFTFKKSE